MSDAGHSGPQPAAPPTAAEAHALAQVEKWMAVREFSGTPRGGWSDTNDAPTGARRPIAANFITRPCAHNSGCPIPGKPTWVRTSRHVGQAQTSDIPPLCCQILPQQSNTTRSVTTVHFGTTCWSMLRWRKNGRRMVYSVLGHAASKGAELLEESLRRPRAVPIIVLLLWACAVLPNLTLHSFIWEEGTNAEIARDVLAHGRFLVPILYGIPWLEKLSLLPWLIAGVAAVSGQVNEWSARLPAMISVLLTALMVQGLTRRYASLQASLFAALCFCSLHCCCRN
jgi:Dolichyl-phosphate-mannose-protein mannosyltransferase